MNGYALKVIEKSGEEHFVCDGVSDTPSRFSSYADAYHWSDFLRIGIGDDVQSINVVKYPKRKKVA